MNSFVTLTVGETYTNQDIIECLSVGIWEECEDLLLQIP